MVPTVIDVLETVNFRPEELRPEDFVFEGWGDVRRGRRPAAGHRLRRLRGVGQTVKLLKHHLLEETDARHLRRAGRRGLQRLRRAVAARRPRAHRHRERLRLIFAMNRIVQAIGAKAKNYEVRLGGVIANRSTRPTRSTSTTTGSA